MVQIREAPNDQNLMCIVYYDAKLPAHHRHLLKVYLKHTCSYIRMFTDIGSFTECLTQPFIVDKLVIIVSGDEAEYLCDNIQNDKELPQALFLYELQFDKASLKSDLPPEKRFQSIGSLVAKIDDDVKAYLSNKTQDDQKAADKSELDLGQVTLPFGIHEFVGKQRSFCHLSREELRFILFQSFIEVLLGMKYDDEEEEKEALKRMWTSCREDPDNQNDPINLPRINEYEQNYASTTSVYTYTSDSFFFRTLNKAFRCEDVDRIFDFQPFISHIHEQLRNLRTEQRSTSTSSPTIFRRGKILPTSLLQQLEDNKEKFISINGFLSTTKSNTVADIYAGIGTNRQGYHPVIFEMHIDEAIDTKRPYADVSKVSAIPREEEVLFFMGFVWRIDALEKQDDQSWKVKLHLSTDLDVALTKSFNELSSKCTFFQLGKILHELGEYKKAIDFYDRMLNFKPELSDKKLLADIHCHMAISALEDGSYTQALGHIKEAERLVSEFTKLSEDQSTKLQPILAEDVSFSPIRILINKGLIYRQKKDYKCAKQSLDEALRKHGSKNDKAHAYYHLGVLELEHGSFQTAHNHFSEAFKLTTDQDLKNTVNQKLHTLNKIPPKKCVHQTELISN